MNTMSYELQMFANRRLKEMLIEILTLRMLKSGIGATTGHSVS